jgi:surface antigen
MSKASLRPSYRATATSRLWRRVPGLLLAAALGCTAGGCSFSYQLGSLFGKEDEAPENTSAIPGRTGTLTAASTIPEDADLAYARAAAAEVLTRGGKDASAPWSNPRTGARGTVTPLASAYTQDGFVCRDFLASYVRDGAEAWLQGEACRMHHGKWEVRKLRPWKKS